MAATVASAVGANCCCSRCRVAAAVGTRPSWESIAPGIFHRLTGAFSAAGLQIRAAQIHTLSVGVVIDRFWVTDPDYADLSPPDRLEEVKAGLAQLITLWPFPRQMMEPLLRKVRAVLVPELNMGQMSREINRINQGMTRIETLNRIDGTLSTPSEIFARLVKL